MAARSVRNGVARVCGGAAAMSLALALGAAALAPTPALAEYAGYWDLSQSHWAVPEVVDWSSEHKAVNGFPDGSWGPDRTITRAQAVTVLYNLSGSPDASGISEPFSDVADGAWYRGAVAWAKSKGLVSGTSATTFSPSDELTREQASALVQRLLGGKAGSASSLAAFADGGEVSSWARGCMSWAVEQGVLSGRTQADGSRLLAPRGTCSRAEYVAMLMNARAEGATPGGGASEARTELAAQIARAKALDTSKYHYASVGDLRKGIERAEAVEADEGADEGELRAAASELASVMEGLKTEEEGSMKYLLDAVISANDGLLEELYTPASYARLQEALAAAQRVSADHGATKAEVDAAEKRLTEAVNGLEEVDYGDPADKDLNGGSYKLVVSGSCLYNGAELISGGPGKDDLRVELDYVNERGTVLHKFHTYDEDFASKFRLTVVPSADHSSATVTVAGTGAFAGSLSAGAKVQRGISVYTVLPACKRCTYMCSQTEPNLGVRYYAYVCTDPAVGGLANLGKPGMYVPWLEGKTNTQLSSDPKWLRCSSPTSWFLYTKELRQPSFFDAIDLYCMNPNCPKYNERLSADEWYIPAITKESGDNAVWGTFVLNAEPGSMG